MASPKSGTACSIIAPIAPKEPHEADSADPGEVAKTKAEQAKSKKGRYGEQKIAPFKPAEATEEEKKELSWVEINLEDEDGEPVAGEPYRVVLPDKSVAEGTTDEKGNARIEGFDPGQCEISFPNLDQTALKEK
ncbi:MAG: hypothetical protein AABZ53_05090 [Planctomycetota bacterium]